MLNKSPKIARASAVIFISAELFLGIVIQIISGRINDYISFASIAMALAFVILSFRHSRIYAFSLLAMITTLCADFLLVICVPQQKLPAMLFFFVTQACYFFVIHLKTERGQSRRAHLIIRISVLSLAVMLTLFVLGDGADALSVVSVAYFANLIMNFIFSLLMRKRSYIFSFGLLEFILCDFFVGMGMIGEYLSLGDSALVSFFVSPPFNAAWLFYVPAQTLLALASRDEGACDEKSEKREKVFA